MKTKEYQVEDFETEFEKAETITSLQELLKRMKMQRVRWNADRGSSYPIPLLDEQMSLVQWELEKLRHAQSRGRFRAYYAFKWILDEHYPCKTPVLQYKYILDDGVRAFRKEILSNMLHLAANEKGPYLVEMQKEMEELLGNVYATEEALQEWCCRYNTSEKEIFAPAATGHTNKVYKMLKAENPVKIMAGEDETNDAYEIQNDFYNVFYGRAIRSVLELVKGQQPPRPPKGGEPDTQGQLIENRKKEVKELEDLFLDKTLCESCLDALRIVTPTVIDENDNYLLGPKKKASVVAWVDVVLKHKIKEVSRQVLAQALNTKLKGLNMGRDGRTLSSKSITDSAVYRHFQRKFNGLFA